jgi:hypothetical protein
MGKNSNYQQAKFELKEFKKEFLSNSTDIPYIRMELNNKADSLSRELTLSKYQQKLLADYVCKLHPK